MALFFIAGKTYPNRTGGLLPTLCISGSDIMRLNAVLRLISPHWGHEDIYSILFDEEHMEVDVGPHKAKATCRENHDPEWSGEALEHLMNRDGIYPPAIGQRMFEHVWLEWRKGNINDRQAVLELEEIAAWLNVISQHKPKSEFWQRFF